MLLAASSFAFAGIAAAVAALRRPSGRARLSVVAVVFGLAALVVSLWPASVGAVAGGLGLALLVLLLVQRRELGEHAERAAALARELRRVEVEAAARAEAGEARVRELADVAPAGFFEADGQGRWTWASERLASVVGRPVEQLLADGWQRLLQPDARARVVARWARAARAGASWTAEQRLACARDEAERWVRLESMPRSAGDGRAGHVGTLIDVTEQRRRETLRQQFEQRLERMHRSESLGDLAGGVAHDVNNLLVGILGGADLALQHAEQAGGDERLRELLSTIRDAATRGADLAAQLLTYARRDDAERRPVELTAIVDEMLALLGSSLLRDVQVDVDHAGPAVVMGSAGSLCQVVSNLITNAAQATGAGGRIAVRTAVETCDAATLAGDVSGAGAQRPGEFVRLEVCDDGPGLPEERVERILEPFFTTREEGRGLGLAVVRGVVRGHDGALLVGRSASGGARFSVLLPAASAAPPGDEPGARAEDLDLTGELLLVVDDEPSVRRVVASMLGACGAEVLLAADAAQAAEHVRRDGPRISLVLLDIALPGCDGPTLLADLRAQCPGLPAALMSGFPAAEGLERAGGNAVGGYLQKPFTAEALARFVSGQLGRAAAGARASG